MLTCHLYLRTVWTILRKCHLIWEEKEKVTDEKWKSSRE